jgi:hypothetical protein
MIENLGLSKSRFLRVSIKDQLPILEAVNNSFKENMVINFLFFWGVAFKKNSDKNDRIAFANLNLLISNLSCTFLKGCRLIIILADNHGKINEIPIDIINSYFADIEKLAIEFQMKTIYLSKIIPEISLESLSNFTAEELEHFKKLEKDLIKSAIKFGSLNTANKRANRYFILKCRERHKLTSYFPNHILISGDRPSHKCILPELPTIYINTMGPKNNQKPWLIKEID